MTSGMIATPPGIGIQALPAEAAIAAAGSTTAGDHAA
jgi:hypothetical protein